MVPLGKYEKSPSNSQGNWVASPLPSATRRSSQAAGRIWARWRYQRRWCQKGRHGQAAWSLDSGSLEHRLSEMDGFQEKLEAYRQPLFFSNLRNMCIYVHLSIFSGSIWTHRESMDGVGKKKGKHKGKQKWDMQITLWSTFGYPQYIHKPCLNILHLVIFGRQPSAANQGPATSPQKQRPGGSRKFRPSHPHRLSRECRLAPPRHLPQWQTTSGPKVVENRIHVAWIFTRTIAISYNVWPFLTTWGPQL